MITLSAEKRLTVKVFTQIFNWSSLVTTSANTSIRPVSPPTPARRLRTPPAFQPLIKDLPNADFKSLNVIHGKW